MCLTVKTVPKTTHDALAVECIKTLASWDLEKNWETPFQNAPIPKNGILLPWEPSAKVEWAAWLNDWERIERGAIHAHMRKDQLTLGSYRKEFKAYAFGVIAFGRNDLACRCLYIPEMDKTPRRAEREAACLRWQTMKRLTPAMVIKVFPEMSTRLCHFKV